MKHFLFSVLILCAFFAHAAQIPVSVVPFTFAGRITDYAHIAYDATSTVEVRLKAADGTILAKTTTSTSGKTSYNYVLQVPVATEKIAHYACVGDAVTFEFVDPLGTIYTGLVSAADSKIGNPGDVKRLDVVLATDSDGDGVADEYLESVEYWMAKAGIEGPYDAAADYDGDGQTNYEEYLAGTNPCDAADSFSVCQMALEDGMEGYVALRIPVSPGRAYSLLHSPNLEEGSWAREAFTSDLSTDSSSTYLITGPSELGYCTIFVKKDGVQHFYKVTVE